MTKCLRSAPVPVTRPPFWADGGLEVYSIEIVPELAQQATGPLAELGYWQVQVKQGDGYYGWPEQAPFDAIIVTAAPDHLPAPLVAQLA